MTQPELEPEAELDLELDGEPGTGPDGDPGGERDLTPDPDRQGLLARMARGASERVLDVVQPDMVLDHVDINALLDRVDVNAVLDRVDINTVLDRVDIDALLSRADIDALMARVDVRAIVDRAGIPEIVAESTGHLTTSALDLFRKPLVGIDEIVFRGANRLVGRDPTEFPDGPGDLTAWVDAKVDERAQIVGRELAEGPGALRTGRYGGPITRLLAVALDGLVVTTGFTLLVGIADYLVGLLANRSLVIPDTGLWYAVGLTIFSFFYMWISLAVFGKTIGKTVVGLRVVGWEGSVLPATKALVRTVTYPLSFLVFGLGLFGVVWGRERRAWHDHFAGSAVVYDWGNRAAQMPTPLADWLERRGTL